jgi:hypothetical protein
VLAALRLEFTRPMCVGWNDYLHFNVIQTGKAAAPKLAAFFFL